MRLTCWVPQTANPYLIGKHPAPTISGYPEPLGTRSRLLGRLTRRKRGQLAAQRTPYLATGDRDDRRSQLIKGQGCLQRVLLEFSTDTQHCLVGSQGQASKARARISRTLRSQTAKSGNQKLQFGRTDVRQRAGDSFQQAQHPLSASIRRGHANNPTTGRTKGPGHLIYEMQLTAGPKEDTGEELG